MWCWGLNNYAQLTTQAGSSPYSTAGTSPNCVNPSKKAGAIIYNSTHDVLQLCNGIGWVALNASYTNPDPCNSSPTVGTVCLDGSVYAGMSGTDKMFVPPADSSNSIAWNNGNASNNTLTNATSTDGEINTSTVTGLDSDSGTAGTQPHQAAQLCADLVAHGHSDWYLPSIDELITISNNAGDIGGFTLNRYWSSTESNSTQAQIVRFDIGAILLSSKNAVRYVRCARK